MQLKKILITLFTTFLLLSNTFSKEYSLTGVELSDNLYKIISQKGHNPSKFLLVRTQNNNFAYNIAFTIKKSATQDDVENKINSLILSFKQEDIFNNLDIFFNLIDFTLQTPLNFDITILLTACDNNLLIGNETMSGTESFCKLIEGSENTCALQIDLNSTNYNYITPGAQSKVSPLWITKLAIDSFEKNNIQVQIKGALFLSLYRLNIFQNNSTLGSYLTKNIPAIEVSLNCNKISKAKINLFLSTFLTSFSTQKNYTDEIHYIPIKLGNKYFWIKEYITIHILLILIIFSLISLCDLSFMFRSRHSIKTIRTKRAIKTFYTLPLYIIVFTVCLIFAQFLSFLIYKTTSLNPEIILTIKFNISFVLISLICLLGFKLQKKANNFVYDYLINIANLLNVFIFAAVDISLLYIFGLIYVISTISHFIKKPIVLFFVLLISMFPYGILIYQVLFYSTNPLIFIFVNPLQNFLLSTVITPIFITYLKILNIIKKSILQNPKNNFLKSKKIIRDNILKYFSLVQIISVIILSVIIILVTNSIKTYNKTKSIQISTHDNILDINSTNLLNTTYVDSNYFSGTNRKISINTSKKAYRVEVFITSQSDNPIFYTTQNYSQTGKSNQVKIDLPDYPPENFSIFYTPDNSKICIIDIYAYYKIDNYEDEFLTENKFKLINKNFIKEKSSMIINLENQQGKIKNE